MKINGKVSSKMRELFELVKKGDLDGLIKSGVNIKDLETRDYVDDTLVKIARELGHQDILDYFFKEIISPIFEDPNKPMTDEYLAWIITLNQVERVELIEDVVEYLVSKGADLNGLVYDYVSYNRSDRAPCNIFRYALKYGRVDVAERLVATNRLDIDATDIRFAEHLNHEALAVELERRCLINYVNRLVEEPEKKTFSLFSVGPSKKENLSAARKRLAQLRGVDVELEQEDIKALTKCELGKIERMNDGNYRFKAANRAITLDPKPRARKQPT